ncbi:hypothetical protein [Riemerella columbipharyngis]|nr:hypothetical protein [Riemerella columbipharyngis]
MKRLLKGLFLLLLLIVLAGCRADEMLTEAKTKDDLANKFSIFVKRSGSDVIDYPKGFRYLALRYDSIHRTNISGREHLEKLKELSKDKPITLTKVEAEPYIDFGIHSQTITEKNGDRWVLYPKVQTGKVVGLVAAVLSDEETKVYYYTVNPLSELYKNNISLFQKAYTKKYFNVKSNRGLSGLIEMAMCGTDDIPSGDIEEVVIIGNPPKSGDHNGDWSWLFNGLYPGYGHYIGGDCLRYIKCFDPVNGFDGGGGGYSPLPPLNDNNGDPCSEMKKMNNSSAYSKKVDELKESSVLSRTYETGYKENKDGTFHSLSPAKSTANSDGMKIDIDADTKGYIHTHIDDYEVEDANGDLQMRMPIRMFSPADVNALMEIAKMQTDGNYDEIYGTMVSSEGIYTIKFTGTKSDIKTGFSGKEWRDKFIYFWNKHSGSNELKFLRFLKDVMGIDGISLYKTGKDGKIENKFLESNNRVKSNDCP